MPTLDELDRLVSIAGYELNEAIRALNFAVTKQYKHKEMLTYFHNVEKNYMEAIKAYLDYVKRAEYCE